MDFCETKMQRLNYRNLTLGYALLICSFCVSVSFAQGRQIPLAPGSVLQQATQLLQGGKLSEAEMLLQAHLATAPRDLKAKVLLGVVFDQQNRVGEAEGVYRDVLRINPGEVSALANLGVLLV